MVDIFGTLGPSCEAEDTLYEMFKEGMTGIRINLSHVMLADCTDKIERIKSAAKRAGVTPKILIDLQGPELRIDDLDAPLSLKEEKSLSLVCNDAPTYRNTSNAEPIASDKKSHEYRAISCARETHEFNSVPVNKKILDALHVGTEVLLDDGKIKAEVTACDGKSAELKILRGGILSSRKSIAIEGATIDMPALTEADLANIAIATKLGITGVMQPFVRSSEDLKHLRSVIEAQNRNSTSIPDSVTAASGNHAPESNSSSSLKIYAKIENRAGIENLKSFFPYADEIIIARGDLGNSMPLWELPKVQKEISRTCRENNKPFMVVTQMLSSMEHSKVPTRAEVSDIYNAVCDGASSVMVTGETAIGQYPMDVIRYLSRTANSL
ncbi:pyruvate kinase [Butyrivibrio sp. AE2032]|uniref:pyruvate kinase n=1 Tax=Butyrivibrio sp. AE2032 TaxID=1458463 RepID=UPI0005544E3C|nr:pyruvate kinase [Butyrivibrio sp. AE2032]